MATYTEQLAQVETAIAKAESIQEGQTPNGARVRRPDITPLYAERRRLMPLAAREAAGRTGPSIRRGAA
jgi:hypothetical protein